MTDNQIRRNGRVNRRKFLTGVGAGVTAGLAGCSEDNEPQQTDTPEDDSTPADDDTPTDDDTPMDSDDIQRGGKPVIGLAVAPATLNPLMATSVYDFYVIDRIWSGGSVVTHPDDQSFQPWIISDWTLNEDNVGSSDPTIVAELRDDVTFSDGESLTAEDLQFTIEYFKEQNPSGSLTGAAHQRVSEVGVDSPDGTTVNVFMDEPDNRWLTSIIGYPVLPKHIWEGVDDHTEYSPRNADELVGAGAWELVDYDWENWFDLEVRDDWPVASDADWLHDDAPFVDGIRFEIFGSQNALEQALLDGDINGAFAAGGLSIPTGIEAERSDNHVVYESPDSGYNHMSFNMRRAPLDDVAFRQFLVKMNDGQWIVDEPFHGIGAIAGDYTVPPAFGDWRLEDPDQIEEFEGIDVPALTYPGTPGTFDLTMEEIEEARDFLRNHPDAKYDYSWGEAQSDITVSPDGQEMYVDGEHVMDVHTDNDGNAGQGPLEFNFQPPQEDIYQARTGQQFVGLMQKIGIPMEPKVQTINSQLSTVYVQEDYDIYSMGWSLGISMTHFSALYGSEGADLDGDADVPMYNPMGYTGADDLIAEDQSIMNFDRRTTQIKKIQAQIWHDAPTAITDYSVLLDPTTTDWDGWVDQLGGVINEYSFLNLRQA